MESYRTVHKSGTGQIIEKKSRFIANIIHCETEDEALAFIEDLKKQYWDATHNCYAYIVGKTNPIERCSDDGEPARTAGRPMLEVLKHEELKDCCCVVTRYFGGTLLGTGGLVRAYSDACKAGVDAAEVIERKPGTKLKIITDYNGIGKLQYLAGKDEIPMLSVNYTDTVTAILLVNERTRGSLEKEMLAATSGKAQFVDLGEVFYAQTSEGCVVFN